jgi:hypothetical protein
MQVAIAVEIEVRLHIIVFFGLTRKKKLKFEMIFVLFRKKKLIMYQN